MENKNELMEIQSGEVGWLESEFASVGKSFCSFKAEDEKGRALLFTAMNNPTFRVEEKLNTTIFLKDIYAEPVTLVGDGGEIVDSVRIVLIDADGNSYGCCSIGMFSALKKLMRVYGMPTWKTPILVQPYQQSTRNGNNKIFTLRVVNE